MKKAPSFFAWLIDDVFEIISMLMTITATIGTLLLLGLAAAVLPFLELDPGKELLRCPQPEETFE